MQPLKVILGDITEQKVDAIVNAANKSLLGGGGVDGAIHKAAGPQLKKECKKLDGCATGEAKITKGYKLPAKYVIHTVGPIWEDEKEDEDNLLRDCYRNSLKLAEKKKLKSIAFPSISTGAYHFPVRRASQIALSEILSFLDNAKSIRRVIFVCFDKATYKSYITTFNEILTSRNSSQR